MPTHEELLQRYANLFAHWQKDPIALVESGIMEIVSAYECDSSGNVKQKGGSARSDVRSYYDADDEKIEPPRTLITKLRPNPIQKKIYYGIDLCRRNNRKAIQTVGKPRGVGLSIGANAFMVASAMTNSGMQAIQVAHKPKPMKNLYRVSRNMVKNLPDWIRPELVSDTQEMMEMRSLDWGISGSTIKSFSATDVESVRSERAIFVLLDEISRYGHPEDYNSAMNSILMDHPLATQLEFSTGNGEDGVFHPRFMMAWEAQGRKNFWEPGCRMFRTANMAIAFYFYHDHQKIVSEEDMLQCEITYDWLEKDLDAEERMMLDTALIPALYDSGWSDTHKRQFALRQMLWRRAKINSEYTYMAKPQVGGGTVNTKTEFQREEPSCVDDIFVSSVGLPAVPPHLRTKVRNAHCVRPLMRGQMVDGKFVQQAPDGYNREQVWLWKAPEDIKGKIVLVVDAAGGASRDQIQTKWDWSLDFTWGSLFEVNGDTAEQIAEYVSQAPIHKAAQHLFALAHFMGRSAGRDNLPHLVVETPSGIVIVNHFRDKDYPSYRIYRKMDEGMVKMSGTKWGISQADRSLRANAVQYMVSRLDTERLVIRSSRIHDQLANYIMVEEGKYAARAKGQGGPASKDDGVITCAYLSYVLENPSTGDGIPLSPVDRVTSGGMLTRPEHGVDFDGTNMKPWFDFLVECREKGIEDPYSIPTVSEAKARQAILQPFAHSIGATA